jgi:hypothetical protein
MVSTFIPLKTIDARQVGPFTVKLVQLAYNATEDLPPLYDVEIWHDWQLHEQARYTSKEAAYAGYVKARLTASGLTAQIALGLAEPLPIRN